MLGGRGGCGCRRGRGTTRQQTSEYRNEGERAGATRQPMGTPQSLDAQPLQNGGVADALYPQRAATALIPVPTDTSDRFQEEGK